jgi:glycosyltransferase 2 family protein
VSARLDRLRPLGPAARAVGFAAALAIVVAMGAKAVRDVDFSAVTWWPLPLAAVAAGVWWLLLARGWALLLRGHAARADVSTWCRTQALRYLPGGIWAPVSRGAVMGGAALDRVATVGAENIIALAAALALGGLALTLAGELAWAPLIVVLALPPVAARFTASRTRIAPARTARAMLNYLAAFAAYIAAALFVQAAVSGWQDPLTVAGAAALSWGAGLVVVIAPGGIGVRELVYAALLAGSIPRGEAVAGALTFRLVTIVAELAVLLAAGRPAVRARISSPPSH